MQFDLLRFKQSSIPSSFIAAIGLFVIVIALWIPFGFYSGDIQEHWHIRAIVDQGTTRYGVTGEFLDDLAITRPMARILFWLAYYISPDSFLGDNLLLISLLWLKGLALMAVILRLFPKQYLLAFLIAAVAILYPIDTGVLSLRIPHVHFGITAYLFALYSILTYWQDNRARYLYVAAVLLTFCGLGYEIFYPLIFFSPVLLLLQERRISKRLIKVSIAWYIAPAVTFMYSVIVIFMLRFGFQGNVYQGSLSLNEIWERAIAPYSNTLFVVWNLPELRFESQWLGIVFPSAAVFFIISGLIALINAKSQRTLSRSELFLFLLGSLLAIGLGFIVLIFTDRSEENLNYRVYLTSSLGAAAFFVAILYQIGTLRKWGFLILNCLVSIVVGLCINFHLNIHQHYVNILYQEGEYFEQILETLPSLPENPTLIIFQEDETILYEPGISLRPYILTPALQYLYGNTETIELAFICGDYRTQCRILNGNIVARFATVPMRFSPDEVIIYLQHSDGSLELLTSHPELPDYHIDLTNVELVPMPARFATIFRN